MATQESTKRVKALFITTWVKKSLTEAKYKLPWKSWDLAIPTRDSKHRFILKKTPGNTVQTRVLTIPNQILIQLWSLNVTQATPANMSPPMITFMILWNQPKSLTIIKRYCKISVLKSKVKIHKIENHLRKVLRSHSRWSMCEIITLSNNQSLVTKPTKIDTRYRIRLVE